MANKKLTLAIMDAPYEKASTTTALRIISAALKKGIDVNVFAYEGAVNLAMKDQAPHANPVKGTTVEQEEHPTTKEFVRSLLEMGKSSPQLTGSIAGCASTSAVPSTSSTASSAAPADFLKMATESTNTLVIPTK